MTIEFRQPITSDEEFQQQFSAFRTPVSTQQSLITAEGNLSAGIVDLTSALQNSRFGDSSMLAVQVDGQVQFISYNTALQQVGDDDDDDTPEVVEQNVTVQLNYVYPRTLQFGAYDYAQDETVFYSHTSGVSSSHTATYILAARTALSSYAAFDIDDWRVVGTYTRTDSAANMLAEKYDVFPGDNISVNGDTIPAFNPLHNPHAGIITSDVLLAEMGAINYRTIGTGYTSLQLKTGVNYFYCRVPIDFDEASFGIINNNTFNVKVSNTIGFDNIPDVFECYIKVEIAGDPSVREIYPEVTNYLYLLWVFADRDNVLDLTDFSSFNWQGHPEDSPSFSENGDFYIYKFWKETGPTLVQFQRLTKNYTPTITLT